MRKDKPCSLCGEIMKNAFHAKLYCDKCRKIAIHKSQKKYEKNNKKPSKYSEEHYRDNFFKSIKEPYHLTMKGFNSVSKIKTQGYRNFFSLKWYDILVKYGKVEDLEDYIVKEYIKFYKKFNTTDAFSFVENNGWLTYRLISDVGLLKIQERCGFKIINPSEEILEENFNNIKVKLGRLPLYHEFEELSIYSVENYAYKFNFKGKVYNRIVKKYCTEKEYKDYLKFRSLHKKQVSFVFSSEEKCLNLFAKILNKEYIPQKTWDWLNGIGGRNLFCDGYFPSLKLVVEYDGLQHYQPVDVFGGRESFLKTQKNDKLKEKLLKSHGIKLIRVDSRDNWENDDYVIEKLRLVGIEVKRKKAS